MATHDLSWDDAGALHGSFSRDYPPCLTIDPGDTVRFATLPSGWEIDANRTRHTPRDPERDRGHALTGPVAIRGAEPPLHLAVRIGTITPGDWGYTGAGGAFGLNPLLGLGQEPHLRMNWRLDQEAGFAVNPTGHRVSMRPFLGVMGMAPDLPGIQSTVPPRGTGGNIDCRELVAGSILYLPVAVQGGLFSAGDGHAAQGDGEVGGIAIECPMRSVHLTFDLVDQPLVETPYANTGAGWITFGFDEDLNQAALFALNAMLTLMARLLGIGDRREALAIATAVVNLRITQMVNGVRGVHAVLPHGALHAP